MISCGGGAWCLVLPFLRLGEFLQHSSYGFDASSRPFFDCQSNRGFSSVFLKREFKIELCLNFPLQENWTETTFDWQSRKGLRRIIAEVLYVVLPEQRLNPFYTYTDFFWPLNFLWQRSSQAEAEVTWLQLYPAKRILSQMLRKLNMADQPNPPDTSTRKFSM